MAIILTITMDDAGSINVNGPIDNVILAYGLLEAAHEAIAEHNRKNANRIVQPATFAGLGKPPSAS